MKVEVRRGAFLVALLLVAGCGHKQQVAQNQPPLAPPIEDTPPPKPDNAPVNLPPPVITVPKPAEPTVTNTPPEQPKPAPRKKKTKAAQPGTTAQPGAQPAPEVASNEGAPKVSAEGTFSSGDPADLKKQTTDSIAETEKGLNDIKRTLSDAEQKTSVQIREFLKQAKAALNSGDVDGAHTLALKAHVLLGELTQ